jgi:hypothetical protein
MGHTAINTLKVKMKTSIITLICLFFINSCGFNSDTNNSAEAQRPAKTTLTGEKSAASKKEALILNQKQVVSESQAIEQETVNSSDIADDDIQQSPNFNKATTIYKAKKLHKSAESPAIKPIITEEDDMPRLD